MADIISSDIYQISEMVLDLEKKFMDTKTEDVLMVGMYGYMASQFTKTMKNSVRMASEWGNENLLLKAKFDSTILSKAIELQIKSINAQPSIMNIMIGFVEKELLESMTNNQLIVSKNCIFKIGTFDFHLEHDLLIQTEKLNTGEYIYTARYIINEYSPNFTKISNPYLPAPIRLLQDNDNFIYIDCELIQTSVKFLNTSIISNNILENKTVDFDFDEQLASFEVTVLSNGETINLTPIYEGMPIENSLYCYYNYLDSDTIRIKFDQDSYNPFNGDNITIRVQSTKGNDGNFEYKLDTIITLDDETDSIDYNGLSCIIKTSDSTNGTDKKSIEELKNILPRESLAKGVIATETDIDTFFNNLNEDNKLIFKKKRHNQQERLYYAYFLAKDVNDNVIPTNTIDVDVFEEDFVVSNNKIVIQPNSRIVYDRKTKIGLIKNIEEDTDEFVYSTPLSTVINKKLLYMSHYLNVLDNTYKFNFSYINNNSFIQFISTRMKVERNFLIDNKFRITMSLTQNTNVNASLITKDENGVIIDSKIKPIIVLSPDSTHNYYAYGEIVSYENNIYQVQFTLDTNNTLNDKNQILLKDLYLGTDVEKSDIYIDINTKMSVYMYADLGINYGSNKMVPNLFDKYTLCNIYTTIEEVELFYNLSSIINTGVTVYKNEKDKIVYRIKGLPVVRKSYIQDINRCNSIVNSLYYRKVYIDEALEYIENGFEIDLKFYNTYGPSQIFNIGYDGLELLDSVNLSLQFIAKLKVGVELTIVELIKQDIKTYIEDINTISISIHMANLTSYIKEKYKTDLDFFDFTGINSYNALYKYIVKKNTDLIDQVPEFLCLNLLNDSVPDISIKTI